MELELKMKIKNGGGFCVLIYCEKEWMKLRYMQKTHITQEEPWRHAFALLFTLCLFCIFVCIMHT